MKLDDDIFSLGNKKNFETQVAKGTLEGQMSLSYEASLEACHGIQIKGSLSAQAKGDAFTELLDTLTAHIELEAQASAGIEVTARLSPNILEGFGLSLIFRVWLEAYVAASLSVGLKAKKLLSEAKKEMKADSLPFQLFKAFLEDINIEAGVWGKASVGFAAHAYLYARGKLLDEAGFDFGMGMGAAFKAGSSIQCFARGRFPDMLQYFQRTQNILLMSLENKLKDIDILSLESRQIFLRVTKVTLNIITQAVLSKKSEKKNIAKHIVVQVSEVICHDILDVLTNWLRNSLNQWLLTLSQNTFNLDNVENAVSTIDTLLKELSQINDISDVINFINHLSVECASLNIEISFLKKPLGAIWSLVFLIDRHNSTLKKLPQVVMHSYQDLLKVSSQRKTLTQPLARQYLLSIGIEDLLFQYAPHSSVWWNDIAKDLGRTRKELLSDIFKWIDKPPTNWKPICRSMIHIVTQIIKKQIMQTIWPRIINYLPKNSELFLYLKEVIEPSLMRFIDFFAPLLEHMLIDNKKEAETFLKQGGVTLLYHFLGRNIAFVSTSLLSHTTRSLDRELGSMAKQIKIGKWSTQVQGFLKQAEAFLEDQLSIDLPHMRLHPDFIKATETFLVKLMKTGQQAFGPNVWTNKRLKSLRHHTTDMLLSLDGATLDFQDGKKLKQSLQNIHTCSFIPQVQGLEESKEVLSQIASEQFDLFFKHVIPALGEYILDIGKMTILSPLIEAAEDIVDFAEDMADSLEKGRQDINRLIIKLQKDIERLMQNIATAFAQWIILIERRITIFLNALKSHGNQLIHNIINQINTTFDNAENAVENVPLIGGVLADGIDAVGDVVERISNKTRREIIHQYEQAIDNIQLGISTIIKGIAKNIVTTSRMRFESDPDRSSQYIDRHLLRHHIKQDTRNSNVLQKLLGIKVGDKHVFSANALEDFIFQKVFSFSAPQQKLNSIQNIYRQKRDIQTNLKDTNKQLRQKKQDTRHAQKLFQEAKGEKKLSIEIISPYAIKEDIRDTVIYGQNIRLHIEIKGVNNTFLDLYGRGPRIKLTLNGQDLPIIPEKWTYNNLSKVLTLLDRLPHEHLRSGTNTLQFFVANGRGKHIQKNILLSVDPKNKIQKSPINVDKSRSRFNAPGVDHQNLNQEKVCFINKGNLNVPMKGWTLRDGYGHTFRFPDNFHLNSQKRVTIKTGKGKNTRATLYWNRHWAVWNNDGDSVYLCDARGVLICEYLFPEKDNL